MKKTLLSLLAVGMLLGLSSPLAAQEQTKPVVVVSISPYDELIKDIDYFGQLTDKPELAQTLEGLLGFFTQNRGLEGLDKTRPWGLVVATDGVNFPKAVFLPVTDVEKLMASLVAFISEPKDAGDGVFEIEVKANAMPLFVKAQDGWAYIAQSADDMALLPKDPSTLLAGLNKQYDIGVRAHIQNVPDFYRQLAIGAITEGVDKNMQRLPDEDDAAYEQRKKFAQAQLQALVTSINEMDQLTIGWALDRDAKKTLFDFTMTAVEGSESAAELAEMKDLKTSYGGFFKPDAMLAVTTTSKFSEEDIAQLKQQIEAAKAQLMQELEKSEEFPNEEAKAAVTSIVSDVFGQINKMIESGRLDLAASIVGEGPYSLVAGGHVGDGSQLPQLVEKIVALLKSEGQLVAFDKEIAKSDDVSFHKITIKAPDGEDADKVARLLGPGNIELVIGTGKESLYAAVGPGGLESLQAARQKSAAGDENQVLPLQLTMSLAQVLKATALIDETKAHLAGIATLLEDAGQDQMRISYRPVPNGVQFHVEAEEGVIKAAGAIGAARQAGAGL